MISDAIQHSGHAFQMWVTFAIIIGALVMFITERATMELTSVGIICVLLMFFHFYPVMDADGTGQVTPTRLLLGFANPALITVLALLVMGQGMVRTGVLDRGADLMLGLGGGRLGFTVIMLIILTAAIAISAFLNNIPVVVIFIPVMEALAHRYRQSPSKLMIPLSYAAVLGGMTTLIGSSTNLLVNGALIDAGAQPFDFFDFSLPGLCLAVAGLAYVILIAPRLLPARRSLADDIIGGSAGKQFIAQIEVSPTSAMIGDGAAGGLFPSLPDMTVRLVQRGEVPVLPPFEGYRIEPGDILVVAATRKALAAALANDPGLLHPDIGGSETSDDRADDGRWLEGGQSLAEVMVAPASGLIGLTLPQIGFRYKTHCIVLGIQRRARMIRSRMTNIRLDAGDVLLIQGQHDDIAHLRQSRDVVLLEWSAEEIPKLDHAKRATLIFLAVIASAGTGVVPIVVAAMIGAAAMCVTGVLTTRQALQAADAKIITTIAAALALGVALNETGGAHYLAGILLTALAGAPTTVVLSAFFLLVALLSNVISTKTAAVLFTPIAIDIANSLGAPPAAFAVAVVFAANCSFASPLGYQTNLLVIGPGHYRFADFIRCGVPLVILLWIVFSVVAPMFYDL